MTELDATSDLGSGSAAAIQPAGAAAFTLSCRDAMRRKSLRRTRWREIAEELESEVFPDVRPSFRLHAGDLVFTIGSCFARNIEKNLEALGCKVPMLDLRLPPEEFDGHPNAAMNKFHPPAFRQAMEWTARIFDRNGVVAWEDCEPLAFELDDGRFLDLDMAVAVTPVPRARFVERRQHIYDIFKQVFTADCLMMTPGVIEAWRDLETGLYLFGAPWGRELMARPERWRFEALSFQKCLEDLLAAIDLVRSRNPAVKVLVTTSPVPLLRTFSGHDIAVANTHSKSVLRAVCGSAPLEREGVDYFPSYEMATLSNPGVVWKGDRLHVSHGFVAKIVGHMLDHYIEGVDEAAACYQRARASLLSRDYARAEAEARQALATLPEHVQARVSLGVALDAQQRWPEAEQELRQALLTDPECSEGHVRLARLLARTGRVDEGVATLDRALGLEALTSVEFRGSDPVLEAASPEDAVRLSQHAVDLFPLHVEVHERLTTALLRADRKPEALAALRRATGLGHPTPLLLMQLARLLLKLGERDEALACAERALVEDPRDREAARFLTELAGDVSAK
jgi:tetratricopeptide (TPR) repeat protein